MTERPTNSSDPGDGVPRPPTPIVYAGAAGLLCLAASIPVMVSIGDESAILRFFLCAPLLLTGFGLWWFTLAKFVAYSDAVRRVREAEPPAADDREDEDRALIAAAGRAMPRQSAGSGDRDPLVAASSD